MGISTQPPPDMHSDKDALFSHVHTGAWAFAVAACISIGTWLNLKAPPPRDLPSDRIEALRAGFEMGIGDGAAAERLSSVITRLPVDRPVLIIRDPAEANLILASQLVSYTAWPRPAVMRDYRGEISGISFEELRKANFSAIFICGPQGGSLPAQTESISNLLKVVLQSPR